jgi:hypothetical protein
MKIYYIYHIEGIKIGCSINPKQRVKRQGYSKFEIIETHTNEDIASYRERQLQIAYGYRVDKTSYKNILNMATTAGRKKGGQEYSKKYSKPIIATKLDNNKSYEFISRKECSQKLCLNIQSIFKVLCGIRKTHKGYTFKYK